MFKHTPLQGLKPDGSQVQTTVKQFKHTPLQGLKQKDRDNGRAGKMFKHTPLQGLKRNIINPFHYQKIV